MSTAEPDFLQRNDLNLIFFSGKGGVGKTTSAVSTALLLARRSPDRPCLLVSSDPAHSVLDSLAGFHPPANLEVNELDAARSLERFRSDHIDKLKEIARRGTFLDDEDISRLTDLSLPGMDELMALLEIARWTETHQYDLVVVDMAPTGHTLRLLAVPDLLRRWLDAMDTLLGKYRYMKKTFAGSYRTDEIDRFLLDETASLSRMEALLHDTSRCVLVPVTLAEPMVLRETSRFLETLSEKKIPSGTVIVNRLFQSSECSACETIRAQQLAALNQWAASFSGRQLWGAPQHAGEVRGQAALETFWDHVFPLCPVSRTAPSTPHEAMPDTPPHSGTTRKTPPHPAASQGARSEGAARGPTAPDKSSAGFSFRVESAPPFPSADMALLIFAGKGGVGKTTLASATALFLAKRDPPRKVLLFSTDPAHSLSDCFELEIGPTPREIIPGLSAMEIDAEAEFRSLRTEYEDELEGLLESLLGGLDLTFDGEVMKRLMDLSPPGIDEVMALTVATEYLRRERFDLLVLDSAPTGHLLRLLEMPELLDQWLKAFFRLLLKYKSILRLPRVSQRLIDVSKQLKGLRGLLPDPGRAAIYGVGIPERMALDETRDLAAACESAGLSYPVHFHNLVTSPETCGLCRAIAEREAKVLDEASAAFPGKAHVLVYRGSRPVGLESLEALGSLLYRS